MRSVVICFPRFASIVVALAVSPSAQAQSQLWFLPIGSNGLDEINATTPGVSGIAYVAGTTEGGLGGPSAGDWDAWLGCVDAVGSMLWVRQMGTPGRDEGLALAPDGSGGLYIGGRTTASLGGPYAGTGDAWLARFDRSGTQTWIRQFGTNKHDSILALASDGQGGVYCAGETYAALGGVWAGNGDAWLARYDASGNRLWIRQFGTGHWDMAECLATDGTAGLFVGGFTFGELGGVHAGTMDCWVARYDSTGQQDWIVQFGTGEWESATGLASDGVGGVFAVGFTDGDLAGPSGGGWDVWLARFDSGGSPAWMWQAGTSASDGAWDVIPDGAGGVFVAGGTGAEFAGISAGGTDAWVGRYTASGVGQWTRQFGTSGSDTASGLAVDGVGGVFVGGISTEAFVTRFGPCYPDCNTDGQLTVADFGCFQTKFVAVDPYSDCNADGQYTVADFGCFQTKFVAGCP